MATNSHAPLEPNRYELVFVPLHSGCSFAFPCDESGFVQLDGLTERARGNYLLVSSRVGQDFQMPSIELTRR